MNNNDLMNILAQVGKNNRQKKQIIWLSIIAGTTILACAAFFIQKRRVSNKYKLASSINAYNSHKMHKNNIQIKEQQDIINQLLADKENKHNSQSSVITPVS